MSTGMGISAGTNLVGGTMQAIAAGLASREMYRQYLGELKRQGAYQGIATGHVNQAIPTMGSDQAGKDMAAAREQRMGDYASAQATPLSVTGNDESAQYKMSDQAAAQRLGGERASLMAYGDWQHQQGLRSNVLQRKLDTLTNFAGGEAGVFPYRMYQAQHADDELAFWGKLIQSVGGSAGALYDAGQVPQSRGVQVAPSYQGAIYSPQYQQGFMTPYGYVPQGWQNLGGAAEGTQVPG